MAISVLHPDTERRKKRQKILAGDVEKKCFDEEERMEQLINKQISLFDGESLEKHIPIVRPDSVNDIHYLFGTDMDGTKTCVKLDMNTFSRHLMILGGIGTGKTNALNQILQQIKEGAQEEDVIIIFDTKGEFEDSFFEEGIDVVLSNSDDACGVDGEQDYWNVFGEIERDEHMQESIIEICKTIFAEHLENTNQIFFPSAAKDILSAIILYIIKKYPESEQNNETLTDIITNELDLGKLFDILNEMPETRSMCAYIDERAGEQALGIIAELLSVFKETFLGNFTKKGNLSMRQLVKEKKGRCIFIEYDLKTGNALKPIYELLFDFALKEALGRKKSGGNVWLVIDEFSLLPRLMHIEDAVNFGRSLGVKMIIGLQNIEQIYDAYGETRARSLMSGFMTKIVFNINDPTSRDYVVELYGKNRKKESYMSAIRQNGLHEEVRDGNVVEDWDISRLQVGDAIISLPYSRPFLFHFANTER